MVTTRGPENRRPEASTWEIIEPKASTVTTKRPKKGTPIEKIVEKIVKKSA